MASGVIPLYYQAAIKRSRYVNSSCIHFADYGDEMLKIHVIGVLDSKDINDEGKYYVMLWE